MLSDIPHIFLTGHPGSGKTTAIKKVLSSIKSNKECSDLLIKGFYTEECRSRGGDRIGFDIVHWLDHQEAKRAVLARMSDRLKKSDPSVGKYLVNIENINAYAITSICHDSRDCDAFSKELVIVDEVGKMEMLSPQFTPSVKNLLNDIATTKKKRMIIGTIPTPRYGRIIPAVEEIRARDDVVVMHVTKSDRDELTEVLKSVVKYVFVGGANGTYIREKIGPFLYKRPIGSSSMLDNKEVKSDTNSSSCVPTSYLQACGPLFLEEVQPKVLLLGETASPLPTNPTHSYYERSMWSVLGKIFQIEYKPIKDMEAATKKDTETYLNLKKLVLSKGICIWDVLANVHEKGKHKRRKKNSEDIPNDINAFLIKYPSIEMIGFIGKKAQVKFSVHGKPSIQEIIMLPSSSLANSRMTIEEKVACWKSSISKFIPDL